MIKRVSQSLVALAFIILGGVTTAEPQIFEESEQEFLEFLGSWELEDGTWVNPLELLGSEDEQLRSISGNEPSYEQPLDHPDHDEPNTIPIPKLTPHQ